MQWLFALGLVIVLCGSVEGSLWASLIAWDFVPVNIGPSKGDPGGAPFAKGIFSYDPTTAVIIDYAERPNGRPGRENEIASQAGYLVQDSNFSVTVKNRGTFAASVDLQIAASWERSMSEWESSYKSLAGRS